MSIVIGPCHSHFPTPVPIRRIKPQVARTSKLPLHSLGEDRGRHRRCNTVLYSRLVLTSSRRPAQRRFQMREVFIGSSGRKPMHSRAARRHTAPSGAPWDAGGWNLSVEAAGGAQLGSTAATSLSRCAVSMSQTAFSHLLAQVTLS